MGGNAREEVIRRLGELRHLVLDLDGTLYRGGTLFPYTRPFLEGLRDLGIGYTFLTNNSSRSRQETLRHLVDLGIPATESQVESSSRVTADHLKGDPAGIETIFLVGTPSLAEEFAAAGFRLADLDDPSPPDAVVVGFDPELGFDRLCRAAFWIDRGVRFIATHVDRICPTDRSTILIDCGAVCAALESATGRAPDRVLGKPDPIMLEKIQERTGLSGARIGVVGDRLYTDMELAHRAGCMAILVLSGETDREQAARARPQPDLVVPDLREVGELLEGLRRGRDG